MPHTAASTIPQFALYGETTPSHQLESVHVEDIYERSSRNGWVIKPHRHSHLFQILVMQSGEMTMTLDDEQRTLKGGWLVVVPTGVVHGYRFRPDTQGMVLSIAVDMRHLETGNQLGRLFEGVLARATVLKLDRKSPFFVQLLQHLQLLRQELASPQEHQGIVLFSLVKLLLIALCRAIGHEHAVSDEGRTGLELIDKLRQLVEAHYKEHWDIADYAESLNVSVSTLNRACRDQLGCTAKKLLQDRLHVEAKRRLIYTRETLDRVADSLGYKDTAYFSRVFKSLEGKAPSEFRRTAQQRN